MADEQEKKPGDPGTVVPPEQKPAGGTIEEKKPPVAEAKPPGGVEPPKGGAGAEPADIGEEADIPEAETLVKLSSKALNSRLARASKKVLKEHFGTDDPAEIKTKIAKWQKLEEKAEADRQASLTELEKERERATKAEKRAADLENERKQERVQHVVQTEEQRLSSAAAELVKPKYVKLVLRDLQEHIAEIAAPLEEGSSATKEEKRAAKRALEKFDEKKWLRAYAKENEDLAIKVEASEPPKKDEAPPPKKAKLNHGAAGDEAPPPPKSGPEAPNFGSKSKKSRAEVNAEFARQGISTRL